MNKTFKILFFLRKPKNQSKEDLPIYMRFTIDGQRMEICTQRKCDPTKWNNIAGRVKGSTESARQVNNYLELLQSNLYEAQRELLNAGHEVTAENIRKKIQGERERSKTLLEVYNYQIKQISELIGKEYALGTLKRYKAALSSLEAFLLWKYNTEDFFLRDLSFQFITEYEFFLKSVRNVGHNTAMGIIKKLKKLVRQTVANEWIAKDPFLKYKITTRETHRTYLLQDEINKIISKEINIERLRLVRDIFLFSCFTGLSYSDVEKLTQQDISTGIDGEKWIFTKRTKTDTDSRIPLLPLALEIIEKYSRDVRCKNSGKLLPVSSNQRLNSYLKDLAATCDINKDLTFHCARHTFATTVTLTNGVPIETVSKMLGHRSLRTTQHYAKILDKKVSDDMKSLREKFKTNPVGAHSKQG